MLVCGLDCADIFYTAWHGGFKNIPYLCHFSVVLMGSRSEIESASMFAAPRLVAIAARAAR
jgi:hypothetical protein